MNAEQAAMLERRAEDFRTHRAYKPTDIGHDNEAFIDVDVKVLPTMQSSLVVEPADGRVRILAEAERRRDYNLNVYDSYESMSPWDRCITRGPAPLLPANYNNGYQIVQTPTHVVILAEMIHEARVIPIGTPHAPAAIKSWSSDSRAHWEGDTLVIDTINFKKAGSSRTAGQGECVACRTASHCTWWSGSRASTSARCTTKLRSTIPMRSPRRGRYRCRCSATMAIKLYACHEENGATDAILRGARVQEAAAQNQPVKIY